MGEMLAFRSGDGVILVEAADAAVRDDGLGAGAEGAGSSGRTGQVFRGGGGLRERASVIDAGKSLDDVVGQIGPVARGIVADLRASADWPDDVEIEFAVKISADSNLVIARASGEANFRIRIRWSGRRAPEDATG